jgi:hypothetical protein
VSENSADLGHFPGRPQPVQARGEGLLQCRRDRVRPALNAALQNEARDLLHEQGYAAGAIAHRLHHIVRGEFADHSRDLRAIEPTKRNKAVVRAHRPRAVKFRARRRDDEERRLLAALGKRA